MTTTERNFGLQVLAMIIRNEFQERKKLRKTTVEHRENMFCYSKDDYLFVKETVNKLIDIEAAESNKRLTRKLQKLTINRPPTTTTRERVTCIGMTINEAERTLLERGPKFAPTREKLTPYDLRKVESAIESSVNWLRRREMDESLSARIPLDKEEDDNATHNLLNDPKIRRLAITTQGITQPPRMNVEKERQSSDLKARIMQAYRQYHPSQSNITKEEKSAMRTLKERDIIIKCSDKSKSLVVLKKDNYLAKANVILADTESYELTNMETEGLEKKISDTLREIKSLKNLPRSIQKTLAPKETRLPEFYGLPKIHKHNSPLRPVIAAFDGPLTPVSVLLERILHQLLKFVPSHIESTAAATRKLRNMFSGLRAPDVIVVTMDVVALYPSIPIEDGISAAMKKLEQHEKDVDTLGISLEDIKSLLELVLANNYFKFGEKTFRQKKGIAMGNHLAPPLAIIFMDQLEQRMLRTAEHKPETYDRYVDDCLMIWKHGQANLLKFINHCNGQHPNIRFTWESTGQRESVSFMDLKISMRENQELEYELYQKQSDSGVNLNFESCIPRHVKTSVATQQFRRAAILSSNPSAQNRSVNKIKTLLRDNGFQESVIEAALHKSQKVPIAKTRNNDSTVSLRLPFCSDSLDKQVRRFVRKSGLPIRIVYDQAPTLKSKLVRSALLEKGCRIHERFVEQNQRKKRRGKPCDDCLSCRAGIKAGDCDKRGGIYLLKCNICSEDYIGESQRPVRKRLQEHHAAARNHSRNTPWGEHMLKHLEVKVQKEPIFAATLLAVELNATTRKAREAIEIRDRKPLINRNKGWRLD